jgi:hypothetical protein
MFTSKPKLVFCFADYDVEYTVVVHDRYTALPYD